MKYMLQEKQPVREAAYLALVPLKASLVDAEIEALGQCSEVARGVVVPDKILHGHKHVWVSRVNLPRSRRVRLNT